MIEIGDYRNNVISLSALDINEYERIFKVFKTSTNDKDFYTYNTLKKIEFPELNSDYIDYYNVLSRMALTTLSYNIYGNIKLWWIIYLLNKEIFTGAPFYVEGGNQLKYIKPFILGSLYFDITKSTVFGGRHY
jgi:hypothetical protein